MFLYLGIKPLTWFRYKNEKQLLKGKLKPEGTSDSILLFTTHKCASTYTSKIFDQITKTNNYIGFDIEAYFSVKSIDPREYFGHQSNREKIFYDKGFYFGPLRYFYNIENLEKYKKVLVLRDPRDVLTSFYYSKKFSHIVISKEFYNDRKKYENKTIDEFVIEYLPEVKKVYENYIKILLNIPNTIVLPYELMIKDFNDWLSKLITFLNLKNAPHALVEQLKTNEKNIRGSREKTSHIRSKYPGDYIKKLKPKTIEILNTEFKEILLSLNYHLETPTLSTNPQKQQ